MRVSTILGIVGILTLLTGIAMMTAIPFSAYFHDSDVMPLLVSSLICAGAGAAMATMLGGIRKTELRPREGLAVVSIAWVVIPFFGSLPFLLTGAIPDFTDAYFESVSGFTTTGSSVVANVEGLSHGILYWRALTHWLGGMGIIVLSLAILPFLGVGGMQLFKAEVAGPSKDKLTPRISETAQLLWGIYVLLTAAETILLMVAGLSFFDSLCHSFATISTGGFSTKNASIAAFDSAFIDGVVTAFMFIGGTNFTLHVLALRGEWTYGKDQEFVFFTVLFVVAVAVVTGALLLQDDHETLLHAIRVSSFNVMTVMSCTGFATADFALWGPLGQAVLFFLMFPGACAGSTGGGLKVVRVLTLLKTGVSIFSRWLHPNVVAPVVMNGKRIEEKILLAVMGFTILYFLTFSTSSILLTWTGVDILTSLSAVAASMANVGPGLGSVGPMANYGHLSDLAKWVLHADMILGRLEILTVFVLFSRTFWKH